MPDDKLSDEILENIKKRALEGDTEAIKWLEQRGIIDLPQPPAPSPF